MADDYERYLADINAFADFFGVNSKQRSSLEWFKNNLQFVYGRGDINKTDLITEVKEEKIPEDGLPGKMYMFRYLPKGKDKLPYWDAFPLVMSLSYKRSEMLGLNLHYLPPKYRIILFDKLLRVVNDKKLGDKARILATYDIMKASSKFRFFKPCIKKYLRTKMRSPLVIVPPKYWNIAVNLPTESFIKSGRNGVWKDSIDKIR
jgi:hypothetical protein